MNQYLTPSADNSGNIALVYSSTPDNTSEQMRDAIKDFEKLIVKAREHECPHTKDEEGEKAQEENQKKLQSFLGWMRNPKDKKLRDTVANAIQNEPSWTIRFILQRYYRRKNFDADLETWFEALKQVFENIEKKKLTGNNIEKLVLIFENVHVWEGGKWPLTDNEISKMTESLEFWYAMNGGCRDVISKRVAGEV